MTIFIDDLDARVVALAARGLEPDERLTYSNGVRKVLYRDPDGNELALAARRSTPVIEALRSLAVGRRGDWVALTEDPPPDRYCANRRRTLDHTNRQPRSAQPSIEPVRIAGHLDPLDTAGTA